MRWSAVGGCLVAAALPPSGAVLGSRAWDSFVSSKDDLAVWESPTSWKVVARKRKGEKLAAAGPPQDVGGFKMLPIKPTGAVELLFAEARPRAGSLPSLEEMKSFVAKASRHIRQPYKFPAVPYSIDQKGQAVYDGGEQVRNIATAVMFLEAGGLSAKQLAALKADVARYLAQFRSPKDAQWGAFLALAMDRLGMPKPELVCTRLCDGLPDADPVFGRGEVSIAIMRSCKGSCDDKVLAALGGMGKTQALVGASDAAFQANWEAQALRAARDVGLSSNVTDFDDKVASLAGMLLSVAGGFSQKSLTNFVAVDFEGLAALKPIAKVEIDGPLTKLWGILQPRMGRIAGFPDWGGGWQGGGKEGVMRFDMGGHVFSAFTYLQP